MRRPNLRDGVVDDLVLFVTALLVRLLYFVLHRDSIYFNQPILDSLWIHQWAQALATGEELAREAFFRAPLYPTLVSWVYRSFGSEPWIIALIQHVLGAVLVVVTCRLGRRLFGRLIGFLAGVLLAFYWVAVFLEGELLIVTLATLLGMTFLYLLLIGSDRRDTTGRWLTLGAAGLVLGLAAIARPNFLILVPLAVGWPLWMWWGGPGGSRRISAADQEGEPGGGRSAMGQWVRRDVVPVLIGVALPVGLVTARNVTVADDWVLIASQGGLNVYVGNGPAADGKTAAAPASVGPMRRDVAARDYRDNITRAGQQVAETELGRSLKGSEVSGYWVRKTFQSIGEDPGRFLGLMGRKIYYLLNGFEIDDNKDLAEVQKESIWATVCFVRMSWVLPLAWVGFCVALLMNKKRYIIILYLMLYSFSIVLFFVNVRMRFPLAPAVFILSGAGLVTVGRTLETLWRERVQSLMTPIVAGVRGRACRGGTVLLLLVLGILATNLQLFAVADRRSRPGFRVNRATLLIERGDCAGAQRAYREALEQEPVMLEALFGRARAYERCGELDEAVEAFTDLGERWPTFPHAPLGEARVRMAIGDSIGAELALRRAIQVAPDFPEVYWSYSRYLMSARRFEEAVAPFEAGLRLDPTRLRSWLNYGYTLAALGRLEEAVRAWEQVLAFRPEDLPGMSPDEMARAREMARSNIERARQSSN